MKRQLSILSRKKSIATTAVHVVGSAYISQARMCMPIPYM